MTGLKAMLAISTVLLCVTSLLLRVVLLPLEAQVHVLLDGREWLRAREEIDRGINCHYANHALQWHGERFAEVGGSAI